MEFKTKYCSRCNRTHKFIRSGDTFLAVFTSCGKILHLMVAR